MKATMGMDRGIILPKRSVDEKLKELTGIDEHINALSVNTNGFLIVEQVSPAKMLKQGVYDLSVQKKRLVSIDLNLVFESLMLPRKIIDIYTVRKTSAERTYAFCDMRTLRLPDDEDIFYFFKIGTLDTINIVRADEITEKEVIMHEMIHIASTILDSYGRHEYIREDEFRKRLRTEAIDKELVDETIERVKASNAIIEVEKGIWERL